MTHVLTPSVTTEFMDGVVVAAARHNVTEHSGCKYVCMYVYVNIQVYVIYWQQYWCHGVSEAPTVFRVCVV